jgi:hypothetical protein
MTDDLNHITAQDLRDFFHLVPECTRQWLDDIGEEAGLALVNNLMGTTIAIPMRSDGRGARRWAMLAGIVGDECMERLSAAYGGEILAVPVMRSVKVAKQSRMVRERVAELRSTGTGSKADAVFSLCIELNRAGRPMTARQIFAILPNG